MTKQSKLASAMVALIGLVALIMASTATAKPNEAGQRGGRDGNRPVFGEILSINEGSITIAPVIPDFIAAIASGRGMDLPTDLPDDVTISLSGDTKWFADGEQADASNFAIGDLIVISVKRGDGDQPTAIRIADEATAKQFMEQRGGQRSGGNRGNQRGGQGRSGNPGNQQGGQGNNRPGNRPAFGEIIALNADSITIRPEVPAFIQAIMAGRGSGKEIELPAELTFTLSDKTRYVVDGEPTGTVPFNVGDRVAVMGGRGEGSAVMAVADYATVEARMVEMGGKGQQGGKGQGGKRGKKGKGGKGRKGGKGGKRPDGPAK